MKRPSFFCYLVGNPLSALALIGSGCFLLYQWWIGQMNNVALLMAIGAISVAMNASDQVDAYRRWKRDWEAMDGIAPGTRLAWLNLPIAIVVWLAAAVGLTKLNPHRPETRYLIAAFTILSASFVILKLYRLLHRLWSRWRLRRPRKPVPVVISLSVPRRSPGPKQFHKGVPLYCANLNQA